MSSLSFATICAISQNASAIVFSAIDSDQEYFSSEGLFLRGMRLDYYAFWWRSVLSVGTVAAPLPSVVGRTILTKPQIGVKHNKNYCVGELRLANTVVLSVLRARVLT
jgi:hypothetical protein